MDSRTVSRRNFIAGGLALAAVNVVGVGRAAAGVAPTWAGSGIEDDPYVVTTVDELQGMNSALDKHFVLGNDIDATATATWNSSAGFYPIGDSGAPFSGTLDGRSYTIDGLTIARSGTSYVGLFGHVTGTVRNLSLTAVDVTADAYTGGLVGNLGHNGLVESVSIAGTVTGDNQVGGLVGEANSATVRDASADVAVTGSYLVGGLVGYSHTSVIEKSSATGDVSMGTSSSSYYYSWYYYGGLTGALTSGSVLKSFATGTVTGEQYVGGLSGYFSGTTVDRAYATGDVAGKYNVGGFGGIFHSASITRAYATGDVTGTVQYVGAFGGYMNGPSLSEVYAAGAVSAAADATNVGGFAGYASSVTATTPAYWDTTTSKQTAATGTSSSYPGIVGLTTAQMTGSAARSNLIGFDFAEGWYTTDSYPRLVWGQPPSDGPADFTVEDDEGESTVRFSTHTPTVGEEVTVTVDISNVGGKAGRFTGNLNDGFKSLGRANPRLQSGESTTLTYTVMFEKRGMHRLFLGSDHVGDVHVQRA